MKKNYYEILGVDKNATAEEIKKAFREQVKKYHPDINPNVSQDYIKQVYEAYNVLSDPAKKAKYDKVGENQDTLYLFNLWKARQEAIRKYKEKKKRERMEYIRWRMEKKKALERQGRRVAYGFLIAIVLVVSVFLGVRGFFSYQESQELASYGKYTTGKVYDFTSGLVSASDAFYYYEVDGEEYGGRSRLAVSFAQMPLSTTGMPVLKGDEFKVRYSVRDPSISRLILDEPTDDQIKRYLNYTAANCTRFLESEEDYKNRKAFCDCIVEEVYEQKGLSGLADVYFQDADYLRNVHHNRYSYYKLSQEDFFVQRKNECKPLLNSTDEAPEFSFQD